ncbi:MAG: fumarate hydratase [Clostridiales Family XIII bacterium]|nr:fumarate hydratase [Clostridiales Family XIII bacterium]
MREIQASYISSAVEGLCLKAAFDLWAPAERRLRACAGLEESEFGKYIFGQIIENIEYARDEQIAICQDTGSAILFVDVGQDAHISGGSLTEALNEGVRRGYSSGYLRKSICSDPIFNRKNTGDNTPAVIHTEIVAGDSVKIAILPKGGGSENMGTLKMLLPSQGLQGVKDFVLESVANAGGNPCPPVIVGVGVGGTMDKAAYLAKRALIRETGLPNPDPSYAALENELLDAINATGIGPQGLGGRVTALAVHIEYFPTHITQLPVAVNLNCHAARYAEIVI